MRPSLDEHRLILRCSARLMLNWLRSSLNEHLDLGVLVDELLHVIDLPPEERLPFDYRGPPSGLCLLTPLILRAS